MSIDLPRKSQLKMQFGAPRQVDFDSEEEYLIHKEQWVNSNPNQYEQVKLAYTAKEIERAESKGIKLYPREQ